ncbi:MAG: dihydrolipoyl dehydrogenase [bacterium]
MSLRVVVLGGGPGGYVAAIRASQLGARVSLVEKDRVGGTCLHWGCIPTKVLKVTAQLMEALKRREELGIELDGDPKLRLDRLMARKRKVVEIQESAIVKMLGRLGVNLVKGLGRVRSPGFLEVESASGESTKLEWDRLILATGSRPLSLPYLPFDGKRILSSSHVLELQELPSRILIVGGGVVGCELACILRGLGSQVTVVEALDRILPLPSLDPDTSIVLEREMRKRGIQVCLRQVVEQIQERNGELEVLLGASPLVEPLGGNLQASKLLGVDRVVVCVGREAASQALGLEKLGLTLEEKGWIRVGPDLQTSVPHVFAVGDALGPGRPMLAHVASAEGLVAAENAMGGKETLQYEAVPSAIFTCPEVAFVGLSQMQAEASGLETGSQTYLMRAVGKAQILGEIAGQAKVVWEKGSNRIVGMQLMGPHVTELVGECTLALKMGARLQDLAGTIHPHPTVSELLGELSHTALGRPVHAILGP